MTGPGPLGRQYWSWDSNVQFKKLLSLVSQAVQGGPWAESQERPEMGGTLLVWLMGWGSQYFSRVLRAGGEFSGGE